MVANWLHEAGTALFEEYTGLWSPLQRLIFVIIVFIAVAVALLAAKRMVLAAAHRSRHIDPTLETFLANLVGATAIVILIVAVLLAAGVPAAALGGMLAVVGFVIGFALKDSLGNLAAGVLILFNRPYSIGESVHIKGHDGSVVEVGIATTRLKTWDGRLVTIPNGAVISDPIMNHTRHATRRTTIEVDVAYDDDLDLAIKTALATAQAHADTLDDPAPDVIVTDLGDDGVGLAVRAWVETAKFVVATSELRRLVKRDLEAAGCTIPFPQRDVHLYAANGNVNPGEVAAPGQGPRAPA